MSDLVGFTDSGRTSRQVREVPEAAVSSRSKIVALFDHLIGTGEQVLRLMTSSTFAQSLPERLKVSSDAKATTSVVSDVLLPHELRLVQRGHPQGGRRQVHLSPRW